MHCIVSENAVVSAFTKYPATGSHQQRTARRFSKARQRCGSRPARSANDSPKILNTFRCTTHACCLHDMLPYPCVQKLDPLLILHQGVRLLAQQACDLSKRDSQAVTPAFFAAQEGHAECLSLMLSLGADAGVSRADGATPLIIASQNGHDACVKMLLRPPPLQRQHLQRPSPASTSASGKDRSSSSSSSSNSGLQAPSARQPPRAGLERRTSSGYTALCLAVAARQEACARELLTAGADVESCDRKGRSPLYLAAAGGNAAMCALLLEHGAKPRHRAAGAGGLEPALVAAARGHAPAALRIIKDAGLDPSEVVDAAGVSLSKHLADLELNGKASRSAGGGRVGGYGNGHKIVALLPASVARLPSTATAASSSETASSAATQASSSGRRASAGNSGSTTASSTSRFGNSSSNSSSSGSSGSSGSRGRNSCSFSRSTAVEPSSAPRAHTGVAARAAAPRQPPASSNSGNGGCATTRGASTGGQATSWSGVHGGQQRGTTPDVSTLQRRRPVGERATAKEKTSWALRLAPSAQPPQQRPQQQQPEAEEGPRCSSEPEGKGGGGDTLLVRMAAFLFDSNGAAAAAAQKKNKQRQPPSSSDGPAATGGTPSAAAPTAVRIATTEAE